jgi:hypothetical protein
MSEEAVVESRSLLSQALAAIAQDEFTAKGLSSEPMVLLMLLLDDSTLEGQTVMGKILLKALDHLKLGEGNRRQRLISEVRDLFLASDEYWEGLSSQGGRIEEGFDALKKGKKDCVLDAHERQAVEKGFLCTSPCVLQLVYANQARNHAVVCRWAPCAPSHCNKVLFMLARKVVTQIPFFPGGHTRSASSAAR